MMSNSALGPSATSAAAAVFFAEEASKQEDEADLGQEEADRSSSTEGPDSPAHSSSSSPVAMMIPAYPDPDSAAGESANGDAPLLPIFAIKFSDEVTKDGDTVRYRLRVRKLTTEPTEPLTIDREYDDFEFLHHTLMTHNQISGVIVPPLPPRPAADPQSAESRSKKQMGSSTKAMQGDDFSQDVRCFDKYMQQMLHHPLFGRDRHLAEYLEHQTAPIRAKIKKGFLAGVKESLETRKTNNVRDADDFFQKEKEWALAYGSHIKDACERFHGVIYAQLRLANQVTHLATLLNASVGGHEGTNAFYNRLNSRFSTCLEDGERAGIEACVSNEEVTFANYLRLWTAYLESENSMLHRRTCLVIDADNASKALVKAKPAKAQAARRLKEEKEHELEQVSRTAEMETRRFHQQRLSEMKDSLIQYTEGQIKAAKDAHNALAQCILKMRDFPLPSVNAVSQQD